MKTQQWQLRKVTEPRTLADVESSREKPVLCWAPHGAAVFPMFVDEMGSWIVTSTGGLVRANPDPKQYNLYAQPPRPTNLEEVPDRRVICTLCSDLEAGQLWFRDSGTWYLLAKSVNSQIQNSGGKPRGTWNLTDHCVELVETEIGVIG